MKSVPRLATIPSVFALGSLLFASCPTNSLAQGLPSSLDGLVSSRSPISAGAKSAGANYGVVYYIPGDDVTDDAVLAQLQLIKEQGYRHINLSSWVWTLPRAGSPLRRRVDLILDWCDRQSMGVWLLHNMQYGTTEGGDFEEAIKDPVAYARPFVADWVETLRGHHCVQGVQLGNEVGPAIPPDASKVPLYTRAFASWLQHRYTSVASINAAWGSRFISFGEVGLPSAGKPGRVDLERFARERFGHFYGSIFKALFKPVLGEKLGYTSKTSPDPYLYRAFPEATVLGWDDLLANHPLWTLRVLADCDTRPPFNNEIHLYHDSFAYFPSIELTRYRYFSDVLSGQWQNSSFAWGSWSKPEIATIHAATARTLADIYRLEPQLRRFDAARRGARLGVLVTENLLEESGRNITARPVLKPGEATSASALTTERATAPLEEAYSALAATGRPWRYVLDAELGKQTRQLDTLIVPSHRRFPLATLRQLGALPRSVRIEWAGPWPRETEYGQPLPPDVLRKLSQRVRQHPNLAEAAAPSADKTLSSLYREPVLVPYTWWSPEKGHFSFGVSYPRLEARRIMETGGTTWVALINHTREAVTLPATASLPWLSKRQRVRDFTVQPPLEMSTSKNEPVTLTPLDVRLYRYDRK